MYAEISTKLSSILEEACSVNIGLWMLVTQHFPLQDKEEVHYPCSHSSSAPA